MDIIQLIMDYRVDTLIIAIATVILTGLFKIPIKKLANKTAISKKITRFVTFFPIFIGFGLTVLCEFLLTNELNFNNEFFIQWLSAVSLSLAIYAFWEKFVPSEKKILSEAEIKANKAVVEELKGKLVDSANVSNATANEVLVTQLVEPTEVVQTSNHKKIILTNNRK